MIFIFLSPFANASDFQYKGQNIDPNCILESNIEKDIDLNKCSQHLGKKITKIFSQGGLVGYQYTENEVPGSISYRYLGKINDSYVVHASAIGGAVSRLDYINYFKINGDKLAIVKRGPAGDRSNGGIYNVRIKDNKILYDLATTAKNFIVSFNHLKKQDNPILENLSDCAVCQFGLVHYYDDKITSVTLNEQIKSDNECLDEMHADIKQKNHLKLTLKEAKNFAKQFISRCAK